MSFPRTYIPGERKVDCDVCGFTYRFSEMRKGVSGNQKGMNVCPPCYDEKHPRDIYKFEPRPEDVIREIK